MKKLTNKLNKSSKTNRLSNWLADTKKKVTSSSVPKTRLKSGVKDRNVDSRVFDLTIQSKVLQQRREIIVGLPKSYHCQIFSPQEYPVIYLLDAERHFKQLRSMLDSMNNATDGNYQIPEVILIGIRSSHRSNRRKDASLKNRTKSFNHDRVKDLTPTRSLIRLDGRTSQKLSISGGAAQFTQFIAEELVPWINKSYRTVDYRLLLGHSLGGLFALDCLLKSSNPFHAVIALDPSIWWDDYVIKKQFMALDDVPGNLFVAAANNSQVLGFNERLASFADMLSRKKTDKENFEFKEFMEEDHNSLPLVGSYYGLLTVFSGFKIPQLWLNLPDADKLVAHFVAFNKRHTLAFLPSEQLVNKLALKWLHVDKIKAFELFELNIKNHPDSSDAYYSIGVSYQEFGQLEEAIQAYRTAMELDHSNEKVAIRLRQLEVKRR